eukprot:1249628-Pyramimonas_sp.AAC.1
MPVGRRHSSTQSAVALSFGEAECRGMVQCGSAAFGPQSIFKNCDVHCGSSLRNASAAVAICQQARTST